MGDGLNKISSYFTLYLINVGKLKRFKNVSSDLKTILKTDVANMRFRELWKRRIMWNHATNVRRYTSVKQGDSWEPGSQNTDWKEAEKIYDRNFTRSKKACKPSKTLSLVLFGPTVIGHSSGFPCQLWHFFFVSVFLNSVQVNLSLFGWQN